MEQKSKAIRKTLTGTVIRTAGVKTINVRVSTYKNHPIYHKRYLSFKNYLVHDERTQAKVGDRVKIIECRPLSRRKRFRLLRVVHELVTPASSQ